MHPGDVQIKIISSLEKCFWDDPLESKAVLSRFSMLKNEKTAFQIAYCYCGGPIEPTPTVLKYSLSGELAPFVSLRQVVNVPSIMPVNPRGHDDDYLRTQPGLFPDLLMPLHYANRISIAVPQLLLSLWAEVELPDGVQAGEYPLSFTLLDDEDVPVATAEVTVEVINAVLPEQTVHHTEWFYTDCLAEYYRVPVFGEEHRRIIGNFARTAAKNGITTLMLPVFTPELDTYVGGERLTTQLVDITLKDGKYSFDFSKVDDFIRLYLESGIKNLEIPPLFTQWGAKAAPKIMATVDGEYRQLFGWDTEASDPAYTAFLGAFLPALLSCLRSHGMDHRTFFHVSDEPPADEIERYGRASDVARRLLQGYTVLDACSHVEIFQKGLLSTPVASVDEVEKFIDAGVPEPWTYYCCYPITRYTNRFMAMPSRRTRILGVQLYRYGIRGFLHWGYNFYHNHLSYDVINPYADTCGEFFAPSGDAYLVYPAPDGTAYESIRLKQMRDAMQDVRLLQLAESCIGRDAVQALITETAGMTVTFGDYPHTDAFLTELREKVHAVLRQKG